MIRKRYNILFKLMKKGAIIYYTFYLKNFVSKIKVYLNGKCVNRITEFEYNLFHRVIILYKEVNENKRLYKLDPKFKKYDKFPYKEILIKKDNFNCINYNNITKNIYKFENKKLIASIVNNSKGVGYES